MVPVRSAENLKLRAEAQLAAAETALGSAISAEAKEQAERAKAKAIAKIAELQVQLAAAKAELQPKLDALTTAREAAAVAETAQVAAAEAARQVARELEPVSVLISRKTQRLYVRQAFEPILESPVTIQDADRPIGTHIFTAMERTGGDTNMRWNVVSLDGGRPPAAWSSHRPGRAGDKVATSSRYIDPGSAKSALDRIVIPQDVLDRIAGIAPRSSLIITDEALSSETGKGTDFVVILSGEPQGGIKIRRRGPVRRPNSVTIAHVITCIIGARLSRFRIPPGKPIVFTSDTFETSFYVRRWVTTEGEPNIAVDDLMDAWRQIGGFTTGTRFTLAPYCRTGRDGLTIMDRI